MTIRKRTSMTLVSLCALLGALALASAPARAAATHEYLPSSSISELPLEGPLKEPLAPPQQLSFPESVTVDAGSLWVAESISGTTQGRVDRFDDASGAFMQQLPEPPPSAELELRHGVALDHVGGETLVYIGGIKTGTREGVVAVFNALTGSVSSIWDGADVIGAPGFGPTGVVDVAADDSQDPSDWAAGRVYVASNPQKMVDVFEAKPGGGEKYIEQLTGTPGGPFGIPYKVTVDQANGDVLVLDGRSGLEEVIDVFEPNPLKIGEYVFVRSITGPPGRAFESVQDVAVDGGAGYVYVAEKASNTVDQFTLADHYEGTISGTPSSGFHEPLAVAVDQSTGDVFVADSNPPDSTIDAFEPSIVIPDVETGSASGVTARGAMLEGAVDPDGVGPATCSFLWGVSEAGLTNSQACSPEEVANGSNPTPVHATLGELEPGTTYYYRLRATNKNGTNTNFGSKPGSFTTLGPSLSGESVSAVGNTGATFEATLDPNGGSTSYYFQYGTTAGYGSDLPLAAEGGQEGIAIGSGHNPVEVRQRAKGLSPETAYHYRVVAVSEIGGRREEFFGHDHTFTTQGGGGALSLPDGREWELVSPPDKFGAVIFPIGEAGLIQASDAGDAFVFLASLPTELGAQGYTHNEQVFATRGQGGWSSRDINPPRGSEPDGFATGAGFEYRSFSEDLSQGLVHPFAPSTEGLSPEATEPTTYLRSLYLNGDPSERCSKLCYTPLVSAGNVLEGAEFGGGPAGEHCIEIFCGPEFAAATPDLSHVVLYSVVPLTEGASPYGLYVWGGGKLTFIGGTLVGGFEKEAKAVHAISNDGTRIVFSGSAEGDEGLLLRDTARSETVQLNAVQGGSGSGPPQAEIQFQAASIDDSKIYFTDEQQLTVNSGAARGRPDLYECEMVEASGGKLVCRLNDLTPQGTGGLGRLGSGGPPEIIDGGVLGVSEDGGYLYFATQGVLTGTEKDASGEEAQAGQPNLYVRHDGTTRLIAVLAGDDSKDWHTQSLNLMTSRVSGNGEWLAFMSDRSLTGYDNRDVSSGAPDEEVYLYNAGEGRLVCASCDPTGARPSGVPYKQISDELVGGDRVWSDGQWIAANVPGWTPYVLDHARYQSRYLSNSGRLFFNSSDALVPQDINHNEDVYEYEPGGVGGAAGCTPSSATFSGSTGGCVALISSGTSSRESAFLDASETGDDVFFLAVEKLVPGDTDTAYDVYDAHVCSEDLPCASEPASSPACVTVETCRAPSSPQPPIFGAPASATFSGTGNLIPAGSTPAVKPKVKKPTLGQKLAQALKACKKDKGLRRRAVCQRRARERYGRVKPSSARVKKGKG